MIVKGFFFRPPFCCMYGWNSSYVKNCIGEVSENIFPLSFSHSLISVSVCLCLSTQNLWNGVYLRVMFAVDMSRWQLFRVHTFFPVWTQKDVVERYIDSICQVVVCFAKSNVHYFCFGWNGFFFAAQILLYSGQRKTGTKFNFDERMHQNKRKRTFLSLSFSLECIWNMALYLYIKTITVQIEHFLKKINEQ